MTKEITVTTIMYRGDSNGNPYSYFDTTLLPFNKWLEEHNKNREVYLFKEDLEDDYWEETEDDFEWFEHTFTI